MTQKPEATNMWSFYKVILQFDGPFAAAIPKDAKEIKAMLEHRQPTNAPEDAVPIDELADQVAEEVGAGEEEESQQGHSTFKKDNDGIYYEGRCVRGHLKDCALQVAPFFPGVKNFRSKVVNRTYVVETRIPMSKTEVEGTEQRFIQVMTKRGPRSSFKFIDYVRDPMMTFTLKVMRDNVIKLEHLQAIFEYGGTHGMGQERSQDWGRYGVVSIHEVNKDGSPVAELEEASSVAG